MVLTWVELAAQEVHVSMMLRHHPCVVLLRILEGLRVHEAVGDHEEQELCAVFLSALNLQYPRFMCPFL